MSVITPSGSRPSLFSSVAAASLVFATVSAAAFGSGSGDCNNNGIPDAAEIAAGLVEDCNGNGLPDPCEYAGVSAEGETGPFGDGNPLVVVIADATPAASDLRLSIEVRADLDAIGEFVQAFVGDTVVATLWITDGQACPGDPQAQTVIVPMATVNAALGANGGDLVVSLEASGVVGVKCESSFGFLAIDYLGDIALPDCLGNGVWDVCDLASDPVLDCNGNGLIDLCEIDADPGLDCDGNGQIDSCDIESGKLEDCDHNGRPDVCDVDCDANGLVDACEIAADPSLDCSGNGVLNDCELAFQHDVFDYDCDANGINDHCEMADAPELDKNGDLVLDRCQYARGDLTLDLVVDGADLAVLLGVWGTTNSPIGDLNADGQVDGSDLATLLGNWGRYLAPWGVVLEEAPDPAVVHDAFASKISMTGLPWRVRDNASRIEMLLVPPGTFMMGCSPSSGTLCYNDEFPIHEVTLTRPFYLGRYEVSQEEWLAVMGTNPSFFGDEPNSDDRPVERVSWDMAKQFVSATGLRLPTEAEWEYACRAGTTTAYNDGTNLDGAVGDLGWFIGNAEERTHVVGSKLPNALGFHDMHGNVWEWCEDWYGYNYYSFSPSIDPPGPSSGSHRILRGGSWFNIVRRLRTSYRGSTQYSGFPESAWGIRGARTP